MFKGSIVALVTPMQEDGQIDYSALEKLIEWQIAARTHGLVIAGTTGESATLDATEHLQLLRFVVEKVRGRLPVIAGAGTNATRSTLQLVANAEEAGADACLLVTPYYNKPPQKGLYLHYKTISENTALPLILYNVPSRTGCDLLPDTILQLANIPTIIGVKEATGDFARVTAIRAKARPDFKIYSGNDHCAYEWMAQGVDGVISVTANVTPEKMSEMCTALLAGDLARAQQLNTSLALLHERLFLESNPIPTKWALQQLGKIGGGIRLPLLTLDKQYHAAVKEALQIAGVLDTCC